jgi:hypothetical protein
VKVVILGIEKILCKCGELSSENWAELTGHCRISCVIARKDHGKVVKQRSELVQR